MLHNNKNVSTLKTLPYVNKSCHLCSCITVTLLTGNYTATQGSLYLSHSPCSRALCGKQFFSLMMRSHASFPGIVSQPYHFLSCSCDSKYRKMQALLFNTGDICKELLHNSLVPFIS